MAKKKHQGAHKYHRIKQRPSERIIYKCEISGCPHYTTPELVVNQESVCWSCGVEFTLTKALLSQRAKPTCMRCRTGKSSRDDKKKDSSVVSVLDTRIEDVVNKLL